MRVVKPPPDAVLREVECAGCKAVVECSRHELAWTLVAHGEDRLVLKCPRCGAETFVMPSLFAGAAA